MIIFFFITISLLGYGEWSLFHPHPGKGQVHPWSRQLISGPYVSIWGLLPCSRVSQQCSGGILTPPEAGTTSKFCLQNVDTILITYPPFQLCLYASISTGFFLSLFYF